MILMLMMNIQLEERKKERNKLQNESRGGEQAKHEKISEEINPFKKACIPFLSKAYRACKAKKIEFKGHFGCRLLASNPRNTSQVKEICFGWRPLVTGKLLPNNKLFWLASYSNMETH